MRKKIFTALLFGILTQAFSIDHEIEDSKNSAPLEQIVTDEENLSTTNNPAKDPIPFTIETRFSYQWFQSSPIRQIYGETIDYQLTGTIPIYQGENFKLRGLNAWWAVDYSQATGHSLGLNNKTKIQIEPITLGLKWIYPKSIFRPYFGLAFKYFFTQTHNDSPYVKKHINYNGPGFVTETGLLVFISKYVFLDFFAAYSWKVYKAPSVSLSNVNTTSLNISGVNAGGGLGVKF